MDQHHRTLCRPETIFRRLDQPAWQVISVDRPEPDIAELELVGATEIAAASLLPDWKKQLVAGKPESSGKQDKDADKYEDADPDQLTPTGSTGNRSPAGN